MKNLIGSLLMMLPLLFAFSTPSGMVTSCPEPTNVHVAGQSSGSISFDWDDCGCIAFVYKVKYVRHSDGYTSAVYTTTSSNFTFTGLQAGTHTFYFWTECGGEPSGIIGNEELVIC